MNVELHDLRADIWGSPCGAGTWAESVHRSENSLIVILSVNREEELVSKKVVVPKYMGEMLAVIPRCLPPATLVVC